MAYTITGQLPASLQGRVHHWRESAMRQLKAQGITRMRWARPVRISMNYWPADSRPRLTVDQAKAVFQVLYRLGVVRTMTQFMKHSFATHEVDPWQPRVEFEIHAYWPGDLYTKE